MAKTWPLKDIALYCDLSPKTANAFQAAYAHRRGTTPPPYYGHLYLGHYLDRVLRKADKAGQLDRLEELMGIEDADETEQEFKKLGLYNDELCKRWSGAWYEIDVGFGSGSYVPGNIMIPIHNNLCLFELGEVYHDPDPWANVPEGKWVQVTLPPRNQHRHSTYALPRIYHCDHCFQQPKQQAYFHKLEHWSDNNFAIWKEIKNTCVVCKTENITPPDAKNWQLSEEGYSMHGHPVCENDACFQSALKSVVELTCLVCGTEI